MPRGCALSQGMLTLSTNGEHINYLDKVTETAVDHRLSLAHLRRLS
jgi:hypothetical protein